MYSFFAENSDRFTRVRLQVLAGSFRVPIVHRTLTWTAGWLTCVRDHSDACVLYTRGLGTPTEIRHNIFDSEQLSHICLVLLT